MQDFEKLGVFYLGREYDLEKKQAREELLLYNSKDLVTHAVCVGMTGSGKTGLCIGLLEEAAIDGIPAIIVDPKGDLPNLLLTFPELEPKDFLPWVNAEDAQKKGVSLEEYAAQQANLWKKGLADWGQDSSRIKRLREAADFTIYTPGSNAGIPVSILKSFAAPPQVIMEDSDLLRERINTTVTSLLNLMGIEADPLQSREHILLSNILDSTWQKGQDLDLAGLIHAIQTPPMTKIGVFDIESFFPSKDRFALAMKLNNLLAAPGFSVWLEGEPLDIDRILYTSDGKPRMSIFSIAHLNDAERMFFVSLLLTQLLGWMRTQSGTTSLRSIFYMDEIFGYFPPVANPPAKAPLMTLLKQARAFGLGIVLATQNPVDLDYKGLSNTGTWFIGRLQTDRDKQRVLDGLEGASASGGKFNRKKMEQILAGLGKRIFLMNNVNEDEPVIFETRWVMSYLRGPLTRTQIKQLMDPKKAAISAAAGAPSTPATAKSARPEAAALRPSLPPEIVQYYLPIRKVQPAGATLLYEPMLLGIGKVFFSDTKLNIATESSLSLLASFSEQPGLINWDDAIEAAIAESDLLKVAQDEKARYGQLPPEAARKQNYLDWSKAFNDWLFRKQSLELLKSPSLQVISKPGESERDFRIRLQLVAREKRDELVEKLRQKYASRMTSLQERIRRAEDALEREAEQAKQQKLQTAISLGTTLLGAVLGRKAVSSSTIGRATTAARGASRAMKEAKDVKRAEENLQVLQQQLAELEEQLAAEIEQVKSSIDPMTENLERFVLRPKKSDISVSLVALTYTPYWQDDKGGMQPAW
ncbi:MAG: ATP-binding protein [candidate division KSB1 bacterium]|nr:ATP-binding protein [candidate division KSB1 bacterium]MDZ7336199.1 ATP-binding protein [candidate division KSB1 bacterium]